MPVQVGVLFPQTEVGADAEAVRAFAETVENAGYRHVGTYEHVVGADPTVHPESRIDNSSSFHEPLVLFGFLAAITRLELATSVIVLPQRQTVLVAKQAAEIDVLSGGRLRLGIGVGWNAVEYAALGMDFRTRGRRSEEQVALLRRLWTEPTVSFEGEFDQVSGAGINPLPYQRPIPIWFGGEAEPALRRAGRLGDGWSPLVGLGDDLERSRDIVHQAAVDAGRDPAMLGMEGTVTWAGDVDQVVDQVEGWRAAGASHLSVKTARTGLDGVDAHLAVLTQIADALRLAPPDVTSRPRPE